MALNIKKLGIIFFAFFFATANGMFLSGCSSLGFGDEDEEIDFMDEEFEEGQAAVGGGASVENLQAKLDDLNTKQAEAQEKITALEDTIGSLESRLTDLQEAKRAVESELISIKEGGAGSSSGEVERLKEKLAGLEEEIGTMSRKRDTGRARVSSLKGGNVKRGYDKAIQLYNSRRYDESLSALEELADMNPPQNLADNIVFWRGQCNYKLGNFERGVNFFQELIDYYPMSNKIHDARYMLGLTYNEMGERSRAVEVLYNALDAGPPPAIKNRIESAIRKIE